MLLKQWIIFLLKWVEFSRKVWSILTKNFIYREKYLENYYCFTCLNNIIKILVQFLYIYFNTLFKRFIDFRRIINFKMVTAVDYGFNFTSKTVPKAFTRRSQSVHYVWFCHIFSEVERLTLKVTHGLRVPVNSTLCSRILWKRGVRSQN